MRASVSLTSLFPSLRGPTVSSHMLIPIIRIIKPTDLDPAPPRFHGIAGGIRRWRGALGAMGDFSLQLPSQGLTRGARLALARQGCATGSFKMNCSESLYATDTQGKTLFQRIELGEELEVAWIGLREKPPSRASPGTEQITPDGIGSEGGRATRRIASDSLKVPRRISLRTRKRNVLASQSIRFSSGGLSSCATFTEGLCNLEDYIHSGDTNNAQQNVASGISASHSAEEIGKPSSDPLETNEHPNLTWFESSKRRSRPMENDFGTKKMSSTVSINRSLTRWDLDSTPSDSEKTDAVVSPSSARGAMAKHSKVSKRQKAQTRGSFEHLVDKTNAASVRQLPGNGSWSRLCRKISRSSAVTNWEYGRELQRGLGMHGSLSLASGLFLILQQGISVTCKGNLTAQDDVCV